LWLSADRAELNYAYTYQFKGDYLWIWD